MMTRRQSAIATIKALIANPPLLLFVEVSGLAGGLAMIIGHNIWSGGRFASHHHTRRMAYGDPRRRTTRPGNRPGETLMTGLAPTIP